MYYDIVTRKPVDRSCDFVPVAGLKGVDDAQDFSRVAAGTGWVGEDGADGSLRVDDEDAADGEGDALLVDVGGVLVVDPVFAMISNLLMLLMLSPCCRPRATHMSYINAILRCLSPMIGKLSLLPEISSMSLIQPLCFSIVFALRPMSLTPLFVNSGSSLAKAPSSVVQTGV